MLFAYHTAVHTLTGVSPFELMYGRPPSHHPFPSTTAYDAVSYQSKLRSKLSQLSDLAETHLTQAAQKQKTTYDQKAMQWSFTVGEQVWLASLMAGKLDSKWEGEWKIQPIQGLTTYTITDGDRTKTVHVNRIHPRLQPTPMSPNTDGPPAERNWEALSMEHYIIDLNEPGPRYPV